MDRIVFEGEVLGLGSISTCAFLDLSVVFFFDDCLASILCFFLSLSLTSHVSLESIVLSKKFLFNFPLSSLNKMFLNYWTDNFGFRFFLLYLHDFLAGISFELFITFLSLIWNQFSPLTIRDHARDNFDDIVNRLKPDEHFLMMAAALS